MPLLPVLKAETSQQHTELESELDLLQRATTPEEHRHFIARFYRHNPPLGSLLARAADWAALGLDFAARRKRDWLRQDLLALGATQARVQDLAANSLRLGPPGWGGLWGLTSCAGGGAPAATRRRATWGRKSRGIICAEA